MTTFPFRQQIVFDIGMHSGQDTEFYLKKGFWVVAVEANPHLVKKATEQFAEPIAEGRLKIESVGLGDHEGTFDFYISDNSVFSSFDKSLGERDGLSEVLKIPVIKLDKLFSKYGIPYYLKVDIEGNDGFVFDTLKKCSVLPKYVSVENGFAWMLDTFKELGYTKFKFVNQALVQNQKLPNPALEGRYTDHDFEYGSSGAFGHEAPGDWKDYTEALKEINEYWSIPNRDAVIHGWYDLHAGRI